MKYWFKNVADNIYIYPKSAPRNLILQTRTSDCNSALQDKVSLKNNIFQICMNNKYIVSIEMIQDDECPIKGVINKIDDNKVIVSKLTEYGEDDGEAILKKENIDTISFLGVDEEDIQLLKRK